MDSPVTAVLAVAELDAGTDFCLVEWSAPAAAQHVREYIAPLHVHHEDDEAWYVLEGELGVLLDGTEHLVAAGGAVFARAGVAHTYWNAASVDTRYLLVMTPRIRALIAALHDPQLRGDRTMERVFEDFSSTLLGWP
jgi:mannose-6-phosphate isomerase-like protein (cupin superfamily)